MFFACPSDRTEALRRGRLRLALRAERKCEVKLWLCLALPVADTRNRFFMPLLGLYLVDIVRSCQKKKAPGAIEGAANHTEGGGGRQGGGTCGGRQTPRAGLIPM